MSCINQSNFALEEDEISKELFLITRSALRKQNVQTKRVFLRVLIEGDLTEQGSVIILHKNGYQNAFANVQLFKNVAYDIR